jgi:hypothetical protein
MFLGSARPGQDPPHAPPRSHRPSQPSLTGEEVVEVSFQGFRGIVYTLFAGLVITTLWVTSLTTLSARANATALLTEAGVHVLNPFLVGHGTGLTQATYDSLEAQARANPSQALALPFVKVTVQGREIAGRTYADVEQVVYNKVAQSYYDGGPDAVFALPPALQQVLPYFGIFNPNNAQLVPGVPGVPGATGVPTPAQLPVFLQPFFTVVGLTPATFTAAGHKSLLGFLPWFWLATGVLGVLAVVLNPGEQKLSALAKGVIHGTWPIAGVLVALLVLSNIYKATFAPYAGILGVVSRVFLPIYGAALALGVATYALTVLLPKLRPGKPAGPAGQAPVGVGVPPGLERFLPPGAPLPPAPLPPLEGPPPGRPPTENPQQ